MTEQATPTGDLAKSVHELVPLVYDELRRLAAHYLRGERRDHTLQPTALVNEAYLCLVAQSKLDWKNRSHFVAIAAQTMRHILVDHARERNALKRGGDRQRVTLEDALASTKSPDIDVLALDEALDKLASFDAAKSRLVELRFFGGLTIDEAAQVLKVSPATVKRMWSIAQAWLHRELRRD